MPTYSVPPRGTLLLVATLLGLALPACAAGDIGSRYTLTTPAGTTTYYYDAGQRLTSLTNPNSESTAWTYLNNDRLESQSLHNTVTTTWTSNALGQPTALHTRKGTGAMDPLLASYTSLAYDGAGNRTGFTATVTGASSLSGTVGYTLDSKDQLTQETSTRNSNYTHNFGYDSAGNPTTFKGSSSTFNSNNQNTAYTWDNNGNPTTYKGTSCSYDVENRLTAYGSALTCGYRGDGLRAWKQPNGGSKTYFLYDGTDVVCELDSSGNLAAHSTYGAAGLVSRRVSSTTTWYGFDAHGSVALTLDANGDAVSKHGWDAYGTSIGSAPSGPYGYGAQWGSYTDSETGLCALAFRAYDPATGRFLTRDPIGYAGGVNLYGYVGNGPASGVDPLGLDRNDAIGALKKHRGEILSISNALGIQPELLAGVLWVEWLAGKVPKWHQINDWISRDLFIGGSIASLGIYSIQQNPKRIPGCETEIGRRDYADSFLGDSLAQALIAGGLLRDLIDQPNRYPNRRGRLNRSEMAIILTEYNRGATGTPASSATAGPYGKKFLADFADIRRYLYKGK